MDKQIKQIVKSFKKQRAQHVLNGDDHLIEFVLMKLVKEHEKQIENIELLLRAVA